MARRSDTAESQLERILYILPAAAREGGASLDELARALDVDPVTVLRDIELATTRSFYHPGGSLDTFTIGVEGDRVTVHPRDLFHRPVRLNAREALALSLGLRTIAADAEPARRKEILALAARLERELSAPDVGTVHDAKEETPAEVRRRMLEQYSHEVEYEPEEDGFAVALGDDTFRGIIADAIEQRCICTFSYLKPGDAAPAERRVIPHHLVYFNGTWYVAAHDLERESLRFFRLDRVLDARPTDEPASDVPVPDLSALLNGGAPYSATDDIAVSVRYSSRVARWIAEHTTVHVDGDGSVVAHHRVADPRWIVRHVLRYGGEAVVEEPEEARGWIAVAASRMAAR